MALTHAEPRRNALFVATFNISDSTMRTGSDKRCSLYFRRSGTGIKINATHTPLASTSEANPVEYTLPLSCVHPFCKHLVSMSE